MYCTNCGNQLTNGEKFCPICGQAQNAAATPQITDNKMRNESFYAFLISLLTSPLLFIIRMLTQETKFVPAGTDGAWRSHNALYLPDNIKAIMVVLLIISTILTIFLMKTSKEGLCGKNKTSTALLFLNIFIGRFIIFAK